ncbi:MAG: hypothetical protein ACI867_001518, partial [Glaciecola sp.]
CARSLVRERTSTPRAARIAGGVTFGGVLVQKGSG